MRADSLTIAFLALTESAKAGAEGDSIFSPFLSVEPGEANGWFLASFAATSKCAVAPEATSWDRARRYCTINTETMATRPAATNPQRRTGQASHPLRGAFVTLSTGSRAGRDNATM